MASKKHDLTPGVEHHPGTFEKLGDNLKHLGGQV
jgi:hypothetical protein